MNYTQKVTFLNGTSIIYVSAYHPERTHTYTHPGFVRQIFHFPQFATSLNSPRHDWLRIWAWNFPSKKLCLVCDTNTNTSGMYVPVRVFVRNHTMLLWYSNKLIGRCYRRFTLMLCLLNGSGFEHQTKLPPLA